MATEIQFNVDQALSKLGELVSAHGPQVIDIAAETVRIDAINSLTGIPGWGLVTFLAWRTARWCFRRMEEADEAWILGVIGASVVVLFAGIAFLCSLLDVWSWVALFNPKLALAHEILSKVAGAAQ